MSLDGNEESGPGGLWRKLRRGLGRTQQTLRARIDAVAGRSDTTPEDLEEVLISADLGVETGLELVERVTAGLRKEEWRDPFKVRERLSDEIAVLLLDAPPPRPVSGQRVTLVVGVNGVGKTTSIAKLAWLAREQGRSVLLGAADTFRAAAIDQLSIWGDRLGVQVVKQKPGSDPSAVVFDTLQAAKARDIDEVIIDTAGRLHTKSNLMDELAKIGRVVEREGGGRSLRTLLVLDATTGQNAVSQAREFTRAVDVDGLFLSKLDGTAKGGIVVALARDLRLPVLHLGVGERAEDVVDFNARDFVRALLD